MSVYGRDSIDAPGMILDVSLSIENPLLVYLMFLRLPICKIDLLAIYYVVLSSVMPYRTLYKGWVDL